MSTNRTLQRRKAFTLVELLVVIGIIALLISILLPSLNRARENAKRVACASLLRQIGIAARAYAAENKDSLPPSNGDTGQSNFGFGSGSSVTWLRQWHPWMQNSNSMTSAEYTDLNAGGARAANAVGANVGRFIARGYMKGDPYKLAFCPSFEPSPTDLNFNDGGAYPFNIHFAERDVKDPTTGATTRVRTYWWKKISKYGKIPSGPIDALNASAGVVTTYDFGNRAIALGVDPMFNVAGTATHFMGASRAFNLLMPDGSVKTSIVPNRVVRATDNTARFTDMVGFLETALNDQAQRNPTFGASGIYGWLPINP